MAGALIKTYYADKLGKKPEEIYSVSIMPCVAKKSEAKRPDMGRDGYRDVDLVLTTREIARLIRHRGIAFKDLEPIKPYGLLAEYTGAGNIFGATGGVMEAALRSAWFLITKTELENVEITAVRGMEGVKEVTIEIPGLGPVKFAVAHGLGNARKIMDKVSQQLADTGKCENTFIEIMACNGGCVGGGGQPFGSDIARRARRGLGLYEEDRNLPKRRSHENPEVTKLYAEYITEGPCSAKSHKLLHTNYFERSVYSGAAIKEATHKH
jgi:NADH-quinone oxidoreductase subunit G